ncbi:hypothetical protein CspeluHIS016_0105630 [Cutaneotrichosporon spelunceum]|uniref:Nucleotide exchange factor Fes1 domain-containing protein n=1 Tax=Cutaneotrichosporon spelunceum TaxID=1672016 RepID=A0AAD3Y9N0_9TREE|nr:hypothetical protein CspeluHIS016_0105630 [Cutaneotrichosporon spelunceum]
MSDLNSLLHWAIENTPTDQGGSGSGAAAPANPEGMQLRFKPAAPGEQPNMSTAATFHSNDPQGDVGLAKPTSEEPKNDNKLSTEMLDLIMGKPDSMTMKEKMAIASNPAADVDERVMALEDFEMLIELIDNANNMSVLKLWQPLLALINDPNDAVARHALWIIGTIVQLNWKGQTDLHNLGGLSLVLDALYPATGDARPANTRAKAAHAFSSALRAWPLPTVALGADNNRGYSALRAGVADPDRVVRRKMTFMLDALVRQSRDSFEGEMPTELANMIEERTKATGGKPGTEGDNLLLALEREGVFKAAIDALARDARAEPEDVNCEENAMRALSRAAEYGALSDEEKAKLKSVWDSWSPQEREQRDFSGVDAEEIEKALA